MRMTLDDNVIASSRRIEAWLFVTMMDVEADFTYLDQLVRGQPVGPDPAVYVAPYRPHWSEALERLQDAFTANVTGMDDEVYTSKGLQNLRPE